MSTRLLERGVGKAESMLNQEKEVSEKAEALIASIKASEIYQNYMLQKAKVGNEPELKYKIDEFRRENFAIQQNLQGEELDRKMEELEAKYATFRQNPLVDQFLSAELAFCRLIQNIEIKVENELDF